jgi:3-hydroxyacyl-CoA dehydrogenase
MLNEQPQKREVNNVVIIGTGLMGTGIAQVFFNLFSLNFL